MKKQQEYLRQYVISILYQHLERMEAIMRLLTISLMSFLFMIGASNFAAASPLKTSFSFDNSEEKGLVIFKVPHPKKPNKPEKTDYSWYGFYEVNLEDQSFGKKVKFVETDDQMLLENESRKDGKPYHFLVLKLKPGTYAQFMSYREQGVRQWVSCKDRGGYVFDVKSGQVNVISGVDGSYNFNGQSFELASDASNDLKQEIDERLNRFPGIKADLNFTAPIAVINYENNYNQKNGFAMKCPSHKKKGFNIQPGDSEAAAIAAGRIPGSPPM